MYQMTNVNKNIIVKFHIVVNYFFKFSSLTIVKFPSTQSENVSFFSIKIMQNCTT
jgi:hypothetical protein